jgi:endo-1,4-beta-D-glucanase Y/4-amino-4-deoxy-L-arabinose transferase-like glycosyltransferase
VANTALSRRQAPAPAAALLARARLALGRGHLALLLGLVLVGLLAHGFNMFNSPSLSRLDDEGIYMAQAWAVLREGRLAPYTYWYDHAPAGWIMIAGWMGLTGGPAALGGAIASGRILMLLLHLAMIPLLYRVARRLGAGTPAAAIATLLFSLSPLAVYYQRLVLLDTIMLFWILVSIELLLDGWGRLSRFLLSGAVFGLAVLSKETAVFLVPAMLLLAWQQRWQHHGRFALVGWPLAMAAVVSLYPLMAVLRGELLPASQSLGFFILGRSDPHVSLMESLRWQAARSGGGLLNLDNQFWQLVRGDWLARDPLLFVGGAAASLVNLARGLRDRRLLTAGLLGLLPLVYLGRGGVVFDFYVLFAVPFFCLNLALLLEPLLARLAPRHAVPAVALAGLLLLGGYAATGQLRPLYTEQPGRASRDALAWIKANLPPASTIVVRDGFWAELREPGAGLPAFAGVHSHWKLAADPAIRGGVFKDDWRTIDYILLTPDLEDDFRTTNNTLALEALQHAHPVRRWASDGAEVVLLKVDKPGATEAALLRDGAAAITARFARDGAYADAEGDVTSEAQSYAMLRAAWLGDRAAFDAAWAWTQAELINPQGLPGWRWRDGALHDANSAADADTDMALALLMAGRRWGDQALLDAGRSMARAIWAHDVAIVAGRPYMSAGSWAPAGEVVAINPSYLAPYAYRVFAAADPEHDWLALVDTSYELLFAASGDPLGAARSAGLPPDWVGLNRATGAIEPVALAADADLTRYAYDAPRTFWRAALDARWSSDGRATALLQQAGFLRDEVARKGAVGAIYAHDGTILEPAPSSVASAGALAALLELDPAAAHGLYAGQILGGLQRDADGALAWGRPDDLYAQDWAWFATALYADALPDLWNTTRSTP